MPFLRAQILRGRVVRTLSQWVLMSAASGPLFYGASVAAWNIVGFGAMKKFSKPICNILGYIEQICKSERESVCIGN